VIIYCSWDILILISKINRNFSTGEYVFLLKYGDKTDYSKKGTRDPM
jgi:hypothetical protein